MSADYNPQVYHFINFVFAVFVATAAGLYIIQGDRVVTAGRLMEFVSPVLLVGLLFIVFKKLQKPQYKSRSPYKYSDIKLYLTYLDKLKSDLFMFALPVLVILIALLVEKRLYLVDLLQAFAVWFAYYFFQRWLFAKK